MFWCVSWNEEVAICEFDDKRSDDSATVLMFGCLVLFASDTVRVANKADGHSDSPSNFAGNSKDCQVHAHWFKYVEWRYMMMQRDQRNCHDQRGKQRPVEGNTK